MKTLETKILDLYAQNGIYKQFWARDIAINKVESYLTCFRNSRMFIDNVLLTIFATTKELHEEQKRLEAN